MNNDTYITKNHGADGGDTLVIGGALHVLTGAHVIGLTAQALGISSDPIPDSTASTIANLKDDFNALLQALRGAGLVRE